MRSISKLTGGFVQAVRFVAVTAIAATIFAGCLSYTVDYVEVSIEGNADSVDAGKTVQFNFLVTASGKDTSQAQRVNWSVSSTNDGKGPVTSGTMVSPSGTLSVSPDEIYPVLYVRATHAAYTSKYDFKQINVKGPKVGSVVLSTAATSVVAGGNVKLSAFVAGQAPNQNLTYSVGSRSDGTGPVVAGSAIAADGTLTVAAAETASSLYVKAQSNSDATKSAIQEIKIVTVTSVTVSADGGTARVLRGGTLKFTAAVAGNNNPGQNVTWKVSANAAGTAAVADGTSIAADGTLTVAAAEVVATLYVTATSAVDTTKSGSLSVVIPTVTSVTVSPVNPQIKRGDGVTFTVRVQGTGNPSQNVTWKLDGVGGTTSATTITSNGMLIVSTAETLSGLIVTATSVDDPSKFGTTMITIPATPAAIVPVTPVTPPPTTTTTPPTTTAPAAGSGAYIITGSGTAFSATKGGAAVGAAGQPIQTVINAIRTDAAGQPVRIQLGNGTTALDIGTAAITFNNTGGTWGAVTLSGKITSAGVGMYATDSSTINIFNNVSLTSSADIVNTGIGSAINNTGGKTTITGGTVRATGSYAVNNTNSGTVDITGGTITANSSAVYNNTNTKVTISGTAMITSADTGGTIFLPAMGSGTTVRLEISGGTVENTRDNGRAVYNFSFGGITITGGTIRATGNNGYAVFNGSTGVVTITGGTISAPKGTAINNTSSGKVTTTANVKIEGKVSP